MSTTSAQWFRVENAEAVASPGVLVYPERIEANVRRMLAMTGGPDRLCPHVKTHKVREIVALQRSLGVEKYKCATIAEAEMVAGAGAASVLLALQPVGPNVGRLVALARKFPATRFATVVDHAASARALSLAAHGAGVTIDLLLDIDCGMHRTGLAPDAAAIDLYALIAGLPGVTAAGLHAYDGHLHEADRALRTAQTHAALVPVQDLRATLRRRGLAVPRLVVGGTPTFPIHAGTPDVECSPGTCVLWDGWSESALPDLDFDWAAVVLTRVISKPAGNRLCLDLGHKAIASEMPPPRVQFFALPEAVAVMHNEEHLVVETPRAGEFSVGDVLYGIPWHICPTMALHASVGVVRGGQLVEQWKVIARDRVLTV